MMKKESTIQVNISSAENSNSPSQLIWELGQVLLLVLAIWLACLLMFGFPIDKVFFLFLAGISTVILYFLLRAFTLKNVVAVLFLFISAVTVCFYQVFLQGYGHIANKVFVVFNELHGFSYIPYMVVAGQEGAYIVFALMPAMLLSAFLIICGKMSGKIVLILCGAVPILLAGFYLSLRPGLYLFLGIVLLLFVSAAMSGLDVRKGRKAAAMLFCGLGFVLLLWGTTQFFLPADQVTVFQGAKNIRAGLTVFSERIRYENKMSLARLPEGDFSEERNFVPTGNVALTVFMEKPCPLFLKGFVGGIYEDDCWRELSRQDTMSEYEGLFAWLNADEFYVQTQFADLSMFSFMAEHGRIRIENIALNDKYFYMPYGVLATGDLAAALVNFNRDNIPLSKEFFGTRKYIFDYFVSPFSDYGWDNIYAVLTDDLLENPLYEEYLKKEKIYRAFVYQHYLSVQQELVVLMDTSFVDTLKDRDYRLIVAEIREFFSGYFTVSHESESRSAGESFLSHFLKTRSGYNIHFATLAVLLLRQAGVPARYAEGYFLPYWEADIYRQVNNITFELSDEYAHAWAEIYVDGVGWLPVEFTPGFFALTENTDSLDEVKNQPKEENEYFYENEQDVPPPGEVATDEPEELMRKNRVLLAVCVALFLLLVYFISGKIYKCRRRGALELPDSRCAVLNTYAHVARLLRFAGFPLNKGFAYDIAEEIGSTYDVPSGKKFRSFLEIVYKAKFSALEKTLNPDESRYVMEYFNELTHAVYLKQGIFGKIFMRMVWLI